MSTTAVCPVCERPQEQGLLDDYCTTALERELGDVAAIVGELDITLSKQARIGTPGKSGLARERIPINVGAMQAADNLGNVLTTWARDVGGAPAECDCGHDDLPAHFHMTPCPVKVAHLARISLDRPLVTKPSHAAARILLSSIPAIRRHPAVVELVDEITDAITQARRAVDRPADRTYLGKCLVPTLDDLGREVTCLEEIYASLTSRHVVCKVCGITHDVVDRRQDLLDRAQDMLFTVQEAAQMVGSYGALSIGESTIRGYVSNGQLGYHGKVAGSSVIRLGDLMAVIATNAGKPTRKLRRAV